MEEGRIVFCVLWNVLVLLRDVATSSRLAPALYRQMLLADGTHVDASYSYSEDARRATAERTVGRGGEKSAAA